MAWDGVNRRRSNHGNEPVTNDDLDEALAVHSEQERARVEGLISGVMRAFPDGVESHRLAHAAQIAAAKAQEEFWSTAKKALITGGVSSLLTLVKIVLLLAALGLTVKFSMPEVFAKTILGVLGR